MASEKTGEHGEQFAMEKERKMLFPVDTVPSLFFLPIFSLQYLVLSIPIILATAVMLADVIGGQDSDSIRAELFSIGLFTSGVTTLIQILFGSRLPVVEGMNSVYIVSIVAILRSSQADGSISSTSMPGNNSSTDPQSWHQHMAGGNLLLASLTHFLLGVLGLAGFLLRFIGPVTLGPTIVLVGISIVEQMIPLCEQNWGITFLSVLLFIIFAFVLGNITVPCPTFICENESSLRFPLFRINAVVLVVGISWLVCYILTMTDIFPSDSRLPGYRTRTDIRIEMIRQTPWFYVPRPFKFGMPTFTGSGYTGMLVVNVVTILECINGYFALARLTDTAPPPVHAVNRGVAVNGLECAVCAVFGNVCGSVTFLSILSCMVVTKVASRAVFITTGVLMIVCGVVGKVGAVFTLIPDPIIGGVNLIAFAMLAAVGISMLKHVDLTSARNLMIVGLSIVLGLKLPKWTDDNRDLINTGNTETTQILVVLMTTPMFITGFVGCLLDNILPGTLEERGMSERQGKADNTEIYTTGTDVYEFSYMSKLLDKLKCCVFCPVSPTYDGCPCCCRSTNEKAEHDD